MITKQQIKQQDEAAIEDFLQKIGTPEEVEEVELLGGGWHYPASILRANGYTDNHDFDSNGWEYDYWVYYKAAGKPTICLSGCGHTGTSSISLGSNDEDDE